MRTGLTLSVALGLVMTAAVQSRADEQADITALIGRAVKAMGGQEKVAKLQACSMKGEARHEEGGKTFSLVHETYVRAWHTYRTDAELRAGGGSRKVLIVINGDRCWLQENRDKVDELPKEVLAFFKDGLYPMRVCQLLPGLKDKAFTMSHLGEVKIGDKQAVGIRIAHKDHKDLNLFFDKENGLPVKSEVRLTMLGGQEVTVEYHFSDYKDFDGIKHFSKITLKADGKEFVTELTEIKAGEKLDESLFAKP
jgi:hypothetical protein